MGATMVDLGILGCTAWIEGAVSGQRRKCTLTAGHYIGPRTGTAPGMHPARNDESWHTDCPAVAGGERPANKTGHDHPGECLVWADQADGAHPADEAPAVPAYPDTEAAQLAQCGAPSCSNTWPHRHGDTCGPHCPCRVHPSEAADTMADAIRAVKEPGRTLGTDIIGGYRADVKIGDTGMSVYGPAKFVANIIRTFADAFEEETER